MKRAEIGDMIATLAAFRDACQVETLYRCYHCQDTGYVVAVAHHRGRSAPGVEPCWICETGKTVRAGWWANLGQPRKPQESKRKGPQEAS